MLKWNHSFQFAGYYAAIEQGYYREAGLEVFLLKPPIGMSSIPLVMAGQAQYGVGSPDVLLYHAHGMPLVVLAGIFQHSPNVLVARADSGIRSLADLRGKRLMAYREDFNLVLDVMLHRSGLSVNDLTFLAHERTVDALAQGRVDVLSAYSFNQQYDLNRLSVPLITFDSRDMGVDVYGDCLFTTEREIRRHPRRTEAFRAASLRGWAYAIAHPESMVELILGTYAPDLSREKLWHQVPLIQQLVSPGTVDIGDMRADRWRRVAQQAVESGLLENELAEDIDYRRFLFSDPAFHAWRHHRKYLFSALTVLSALSLVAAGVMVWLTARICRRRTEFRQLSQNYQQLFQNSLSAVMLCELIFDEAGGAVDFKVIDANPAFENHSSLKLKNVVGRRVSEFYPGFEDLGLIETYGEIARSGTQRNFAFYLERSQRHFTLQVYPLDAARIVLIFVDDTALFFNETLLVLNNQLMQLLQGTTDFDSRLKELFDILFHIPQVEAGGFYRLDAGKNQLSLVFCRGVSESFRHEVDQIATDSVLGRRIINGEIVWITPDGPVADVNLQGSFQRENIRFGIIFPLAWNRKVCGCMTFVSRKLDTFSMPLLRGMESMCQHIAATLARLDAEQVLRENEENFRAMTQTTQDGLVVVDDRNAIVFANESFLKMMRVPLELIVSANIMDFLQTEWSRLNKAIEKLAMFEGLSNPWEGSLTGCGENGRKIEFAVGKIQWKNHPARLFEIKDVVWRIRSRKSRRF